MDEFKIELFESGNVQKKFPWFRSLSVIECNSIAEIIYDKFGLPSDTKAQEFVNFIDNKQLFIDNFNATDNFNLSSLFSYIKIEPLDKILINWFHYDKIDEFLFSDLEKYFDDIWFESSDDIDIFDKNLEW